MLKRFVETVQWHRRSLFPVPEGRRGIRARDHRRVVGGHWDALGRLQFAFLTQQAGLTPQDVFLDVACGSLRAGRLLIPYLEPGHYLGIDKQAELVREGRAREVPVDVWEARRPEIVITSRFDFNLLSKRPTKALAHSLFTHLRMNDIQECLRRLWPHAAPGCVFYATFNETSTQRTYLLGSHSGRRFEHTRATILACGSDAGWQSEYLGDWGHPRGQKMLRFTKPGHD